MRDSINYDLQVDDSDNYKLKTEESINVIVKQGGGGTAYYDTTANWNAQLHLIAEEAAFYVYSDKSTITDERGRTKFVPGLKIGDGTSYLIDMPFVGDEELKALATHINDSDAHVSESDRKSWNNKVTGFLSPEDNETLVLSKI